MTDPLPPATPRVVGLDISLTGTGIASSRGWTRKVGRSNVTTAPLLVRMAQVGELARAIVNHVGVADLVVVEVPAFSRSGGGTLERSALWWLVVRSLISAEIPVAECFNNTRMRYATGKGMAAKTVIVDAVARRFPQYTTAGDDNLADAIVLAAMGSDHLGYPLAVMPKTHRVALDTVNWPHVAGWSTSDRHNTRETP